MHMILFAIAPEFFLVPCLLDNDVTMALAGCYLIPGASGKPSPRLKNY